MLVNKIISKALGLRNGFALFLFAYHFGHSFEIYGERFTLCFTGPANLLGGFVFMASSLSFFFSSPFQKKGEGQGREHISDDLSISFVEITDTLD